MYLWSGRLAAPASIKDSTAALCANDAFFLETSAPPRGTCFMLDKVSADSVQGHWERIPTAEAYRSVLEQSTLLSLSTKTVLS